MTEPRIEFVRLSEVSLLDVLPVLNEPRNWRHLPLAGEQFTETSAGKWVAAKDAQWKAHGCGPWAVRVDGEFAGWGGFQHEENGADFALVLKPTRWGHGADVTRAALNRGFAGSSRRELAVCNHPWRALVTELLCQSVCGRYRLGLRSRYGHSSRRTSNHAQPGSLSSTMAGGDLPSRMADSAISLGPRS